MMGFFKHVRKGIDFLNQMETSEVKTRVEVLVKSRQEIEGLILDCEEKKKELESIQQSLRNKISRIGGKIKPEEVYSIAFASGFDHAWDFLIPFFKESNEKMRRLIEEKAIDQTLKNLEPVIDERIKKLKLVHFQPLNELLKKRQQFENQLQVEKEEIEKARLEAFIQVLDWSLNGNNLPED